MVFAILAVCFDVHGSPEGIRAIRFAARDGGVLGIEDTAFDSNAPTVPSVLDQPFLDGDAISKYLRCYDIQDSIVVPTAERALPITADDMDVLPGRVKRQW